MKKLLLILGLGLAYLATPAPAQAWWYLPSYKVDAGAKVWCNVSKLDYCTSAPWYSYFPYDAYFQTPAPLGCGQAYWPRMQSFMAPPGGGAPPPGPAGPGMPYAPVSYAPSGPGYWYAR